MEETAYAAEHKGYERTIDREAAGPIAEGMESLTTAIVAANEHLRKLEARITPVLASSPRDRASETVPALAVRGDSPSAAYFRATLNEVNDLCEMIRQLTLRVEL